MVPSRAVDWIACRSGAVALFSLYIRLWESVAVCEGRNQTAHARRSVDIFKLLLVRKTFGRRGIVLCVSFPSLPPPPSLPSHKHNARCSAHRANQLGTPVWRKDCEDLVWACTSTM